MFSLTCVWINNWVNNREDGDLGRYRAHYEVIVMIMFVLFLISSKLLVGIHWMQKEHELLAENGNFVQPKFS